MGEQLSSLIASRSDAGAIVRSRRSLRGSSSSAPRRRQRAATLAEERHRLRDEGAPHWLDRGAQPTSSIVCPSCPGCYSTTTSARGTSSSARDGFVAVDWESARRARPAALGPALLPDRCPPAAGGCEVARAARRRRRSASCAATPRHPPSSSIGSAAPSRRPQYLIDAVGAVATLCWLHHGLSHVSRRAAADRTEPGSAAVLSPIDRLAPRWLEDPALGLGWSAWRR